ncbi:homeodomain-interacting protein kinase 2 [Acyrthosiphon pisum]|uniref:Protein kinase domain-containing protein n=1 Tax=Acyrthosiphon pisum TaxID=7029 RepID=A0A8R2A8H6_ACYPI|nr:homeodomain-interacting protein kinase 2 [Acyrthosiphon pisum]|eukprot:XP_003246296.1 PREDICTED: homeodomain-interacting protein kinase 2-like [Acyrthosiphon pisum]
MALAGINEENVLQENTTIRSLDATYAVHKIIGTGRFSCVYNATEVGTGNAVVIKALNDSDSSRRLDRKLYLKELDFLNRLKSSQLRARYVQLRDTVLLKSGMICFVMERLSATLQAVLHNIGPLPMYMCRPIVRQIAQGLAGLKVFGIVHADLKPDNIMFTSWTKTDLQVKIIDFGWAFDMKNVHTMYQKQIQAIPYRAPEVCFQGSLDHGLDMWALGCIMPEIVTGVKLFDVDEEELLIKMIIRTRPVPEYLISNYPTNFYDTKLPVGWIQFQNLHYDVIEQDDQQCCEDIKWFMDLVYQMLVVMPDTRITAVDALAHPFLTIMHFIKYPSTAMTKKNAKLMESCKLDI